jgi:DNA-binding transcriptional regulator PaaX
MKYNNPMDQLKRDQVSAVVDGLLRFIATGGFISVALFTPGALSAFDKPLAKKLLQLDKSARERELRRITYYMKQRGLISYQTRDYEHGIKLTKAGRQRLKQKSAILAIPHPAKWDRRWRLVFFDVPVDKNSRRQRLTIQLRRLGLQQLQKSIWIHPFPFRAEIEALGEEVGIRKYITYVEVLHIDQDKLLRSRFKNILNL